MGCVVRVWVLLCGVVGGCGLTGPPAVSFVCSGGGGGLVVVCIVDAGLCSVRGPPLVWGGGVFPLLFRPPLGSLGVGGGGGGVCLCWPVSTSRLRPLPVFHVWPIDPVVCWGPSSSTGCCCGDLVLKVVSRLDAFSGYPVRT